MKLLLVADLHYTLRQWDWLRAAADRFDLVVVAGDLLDIASIVPLEAQIIVVRKYLTRLAAKRPLLISSGNHDILPVPGEVERRADWLHEEQDQRVRVDGECYEEGGLFFSILPWWDGPDTRAATEAQLATHATHAAGLRWVWIYHPPAQGSPTAWNGRRDLGDPYLVDWVARYQPEFILGGHIHNAPFYPEGSWIDLLDRTWVFNSGRQPGGVPTFTILDFEANVATWVAADRAERAALHQPLVRTALD